MINQSTTQPGGQHDMDEGHAPAKLDPQRILAGLKQHFWLMLLFPTLCAGLGWAFLKRTPSEYEATSVLELAGESLHVLKVEGLDRPATSDPAGVNTMVQAIKSRSVLERVAQELKLADRAEFAGKSAPGSKAALDSAVQVLQGTVKAAVRTGTRLLDVTVRHADPKITAELANSVALALVSELGSQRDKIHDSANSFLVQEAERLRDKLKNSELALQAYKADNDAVSLDEKRDLVLSQMKGMSEQVSSSSANRLRLQIDLENCRKAANKTQELLNIPSVATHPKVSAIVGQLSSRTAELAVLSERYKPKHPRYIALKSEIDNLHGQLDVVLTNAVDLLESGFRQATDLETQLQANLKNREKQSLDLEKMGVQYNVLRRDMETDQAIYQSVLSRLKEVDLSKGVEQPPVRLQQLATVPMVAVYPLPLKTMTAFTSGGGMAAFGLIMLLALSDSSLRSVEDAEKRLKLPVLAAVPEEKAVASRSSSLGLESLHQPDGRVAENFKTLRAMVSLLGRQEQRRIVLFTSALPAEGKTFCAANYAISLAQQGLRTLLIDADLRRPQVGNLFFPGEDRPGFADLILGTAGIKQTVHPTDQSGLSILPAGCAVPNPAELLASIPLAQGFRYLLDSGFDRIVIDSAPLLPVSDTFLMAPHVDTLLMVVRACKTSISAVERVLSRLKETGKAPSGVILNRLETSGFSYYSQHYYQGYSSRSAGKAEGKGALLEQIHSTAA